MKQFIRAAFILISMTSNNALSTEQEAEAPPVPVKIEDYVFEYQEFGSVKSFVENSASEEKGISFHSVTLSYSLKGDNIVESPTLLDSLSKAAAEKCSDLAGSASGNIISKTRTVSPWKITGKYICALKT